MAKPKTKKTKKDAGNQSLYEKRQLLSRDYQQVILSYDEEESFFATSNVTQEPAFNVSDIPEVIAWLRSIEEEK